MPPRRSAQAGFTLVELLVVVTIVAVLGLIIGRGMTRQDNASAVTRFAQRVLISMRQARNEAISTTRVVRLTFRADGRAVFLDGASLLGAGPPATSVWQRLASSEASSRIRIQGVKAGAVVPPDTTPPVDGLGVDIRFNPNGTVDVVGSTNSGATVYLRDDADKYRAKVVLFGMTGYAHLLPRW